MACCAGATNEGDGAKHLGSSRPEDGSDRQGSEDETQRSILVSYIPKGVNEDKLEIHFMRKSNGGSEIESITMVTDTEAKITYLDSAAVETVLEKPHILNGAEVKVQKWTPPEEVSATAEEDSRSIRVCDIPKGVSRDKLEIHFQRTSNGGGDIESITMVTDTEAKITFQDGAAVETVLARPQVLDCVNVEVRVQKWTPPEQDTKVSATAVETSRSILVPIPKGVTVEELKAYFTEASNGGGGIESITMVTESVAMITYVNSAAVKTVLGKQHILNGIEVTVQEEQEVFEEVHATVSADAADLIQPDMLDKIEIETGIRWEKVDEAIEVKGTFKQVEEAQQLLQEWLDQHIKQGLESANDSTTTDYKEDNTTTDREKSLDDDLKKTKPVGGNIRVTALDDAGPDGLDEDHPTHPNKRIKQESRVNPDTARKDGGSCMKERQRNGDMPVENISATTASNQDADDAPHNGNDAQEEDSKGTSFQGEDTGELKMEQYHTAVTVGYDGQPQQMGEQKGDAARNSSAYKDTTSTPDEERLKLGSASGPSNEEACPGGSADKDKDIEDFREAKEEPEQMDTGEAPDSLHAKPTPGPLSEDDEPMLSDNEDPQTQIPSNSTSPPNEPKKDEISAPADDAGHDDDHVPGDQSITRSVRAEADDTTEIDGDNLTPTDNDASSPDDSKTTESTKRDESSDYNDAEATQPRGPTRRNKAFSHEKLDKNGMPVDQLCPVASDTTGKLSTSKEHKADGADQEDSSLFEVPVDPDVLTYLRHKHHAEITDIGKRYMSVFETSSDNTKASFAPTRFVGKDPEPEKAMEEFITLYQQVFIKIKCEDFHVAQYNLAPTFLLDGVRKVRQGHPEVIIKSTNDDKTVRFMGEPEKIRAARADLCGLLAIPVSKGSRGRRNNPPTSTESTESTTDAPKGAEGDENSPVILFTHTFEQGIEVKVAHGNITTLKVDAIVNAADGLLKHGGGVAKAIVQAGGYIIQEESTKKMKTRGFLKPTETEITGAGSLPCKNIIHAHGPKWQDNQAKQCTDMLTKTCINILQAAEGLHAESVAIPAISSGKYGMPKHLCAQALLSGVIEYISKKHAPTCSLKDIWFIDMTGETIEVLVEVFATEIPLLQSQSRPMYEKAKPKPTAKQHSRASQPPVSSQTQNKTYASVAAKGNGKTKSSPASGPSHRNDSSQVAALISPGKGPGYAQQVTQDRSSQQDKGGATGGGNNYGTTGAATRQKTSGQPSTGKDKDDKKCPICLSVPANPQSLPCKDKGCKAVFCKKCLDKAMKTKSQCPVCSAILGKLMGSQPEGSMKVIYNRQLNLAGYKQTGTIIIDYAFRDGIQGSEHPNPGKPYTGTTRRAYLPYNAVGTKVLRLLKQAFEQKLIFTIGTSSSTGHSDTVIWNDIHHKTSTHGGPSMHGYPDPGYLQRVTEELAAKGIK